MVGKKNGRKPSSVVAALPGTVEQLRAKYGKLLPHLDENQQRLLVAGDVLSHGLRLAAASKASGLARSTICRGIEDLKTGQVPDSVRRSGGDRKAKLRNSPALRGHWRACGI